MCAKRRYLRTIKGQTWGLFLGAATGGVAEWTGIKGIAFASVVLFILAVSLRVWSVGSGLQRSWYDARMVAESVKSLAWRYAVCAEPFERAMTDEEATDALARRVQQVLDDVAAKEGEARGDRAEVQLSAAIAALRAASLPERASAYGRGRLEDQRRWFAGKASGEGRRARLWNLVFFVSSGLAIGAGLVQAFGWLSISLLSVGSFVAAGSLIWIGVNRFDRQARAYDLLSRELVVMQLELNDLSEECRFSEFVDAAEEVLAGELINWRVARPGPSAPHTLPVPGPSVATRAGLAAGPPSR